MDYRLMENMISISGVSRSIKLNEAGHFFDTPTHWGARSAPQDYLLIWVLSGKGIVESEGKKYQAVPGELYCFLKGRAHEYGADPQEPWDILWLHFDGELALDLITRLRGKEGLRRKLGLRFPEITRLWIELIQQYVKDSDGLLCSGQLLHLLGLIDDYLRLGRSGNVPDQQRLKTRKLLELIQNHLSDPITLEQMAGIYGLSRAQFVRVFRQQFDCSPVDFLIRQRIYQASLLMRQTSLSVKEVATQIGYEDEFYFSRIFKKKTGLSPAAYQREIRS